MSSYVIEPDYVIELNQDYTVSNHGIHKSACSYYRRKFFNNADNNVLSQMGGRLSGNFKKELNYDMLSPANVYTTKVFNKNMRKMRLVSEKLGELAYEKDKVNASFISKEEYEKLKILNKKEWTVPIILSLTEEEFARYSKKDDKNKYYITNDNCMKEFLKTKNIDLSLYDKDKWIHHQQVLVIL